MQNTIASFNKKNKATLATIATAESLASIPYRKFNRIEKAFPQVKYKFIMSGNPPMNKPNFIHKRFSEVVLSVLTDKYNGGLNIRIYEGLLSGLGFDISKARYESYLDKLDYKSGTLNKLDDMHIRLMSISEGPTQDSSQDHNQLFIRIFHE